MPEVQLLSNRSHHVLVTAAGGGFSRWNSLAVTRWREDAIRHPWGSLCYLREEVRAAVWSTTVRPLPPLAERSDCRLEALRVRFTRQVNDIQSRAEILVSSETAVELRRVVITNLSARRRTLSATSYAEVVLAAADSDAAHPAFSMLFVETVIDLQT